jgi:hypothetical protein
MEGFHAQGCRRGDGTAVARICEEALEIEDRIRGRTQYFGGTIATKHTVKEITSLARPTTCRRVAALLGYVDAIANIFTTLLKPISDDLMLFAATPDNFQTIRGWTATLSAGIRSRSRCIDDHDLLLDEGSVPKEDDLPGTRRLDATIRTSRCESPRSGSIACEGRLQINCDTSSTRTGSCCRRLSRALSDRKPFEAAQKADRRPPIPGRQVDDQLTAYAVLLAGSPGLFHPETGAGRGRRFSLLSADPDVARRHLELKTCDVLTQPLGRRRWRRAAREPRRAEAESRRARREIPRTSSAASVSALIVLVHNLSRVRVSESRTRASVVS